MISHFGFSGLDTFVLAGLGMWPKPVFASQSVIRFLARPRTAPISVAFPTLSKPFEESPRRNPRFTANSDPNVKYAIDVLWEGAGRPDRAGWYSDAGLEGNEAIESASRLGGYTMWGVDPFLQYQKTR